jgi:predicted Zn-dependent protease
LWAKAEKEEAALLKRAKTYDDPLLEEYLTRLADRMMSESARAAGGPGLKVGVIRDPTLNAFAMPNGRIYVHTGLLSRVENEAQLATILGHELTHYTNRHALRFTRDAQNKQAMYTVAAVAASIGVAVAAGSRASSGDYVGAAVLSQTANAVLGLGLTLATMAAINGYGRDLEREADKEGLERLVQAGYDPREAPKVFQLLQGESGDRGAVETFFFGSHPRLQERIDATSILVQQQYASLPAEPARLRNTEEFDLRMRTVVRENAYEDVRMGRFALARKQLDRVLALTPNDPMAQLYYGDLHRLQGQRARSVADKDAEGGRALQRYERAAELDPTFPDPYRQLGFLYYQQKDMAKARTAFEKYLELKPDAPDARRIKEYLVELKR